MTFHSIVSVYQVSILSSVRYPISSYRLESTKFLPVRSNISYTGFLLWMMATLQSVESKSRVRACVKIPPTLGPPPSVTDWGSVPEITQLGLQMPKAGSYLIFI